ncbi:MAG TPA: MerR family transcriptional regulator [Candidatus Limnocylindrales bacterium]
MTHPDLASPDPVSPGGVVPPVVGPDSPDVVVPPLLRIQEVAGETGLTPRTIRYYEEMGLLAPAARSGGAYRLYDADDLDRLRFIRGLRDDAGFSLAEIRQLLEDDRARARNRARFHATQDAVERRTLLGEALERTDRQWATLHDKMARLEAMLDEVSERRARLAARLADLDDDPQPVRAEPPVPAEPPVRERPAGDAP